MEYVLTEGRLNEGNLNSNTELLINSGIPIPKNYIDFITKHNGGEGFIGKNYIIFWKLEELEQFNREYEVDVYAPGIFIFASSGDGEAYGFDTYNVNCPIIRIPFIGMSRRHMIFVANDLPSLFSDFRKHDDYV